MPAIPLRLDPTVQLAAGFDAIRAELGIVTGFPDDVLAEADEVVRRGPRPAAGVDHTDLPLLTIDPPGSMDLDQAMAITRTGAAGGGRPGYRLHYAIADVGAFVEPGGALDGEARARAVTVYLPDEKAPLHPPALSEGAASLLPGQDRQALVWTIDLDADGQPGEVRLERARVRSRARFTYAEVQRDLEAGRAVESLQLLAEVGRLREIAERERGGVSLPVPDQRVVEIGGRYRLEYRAPLPTEGWNAQLSLLTGMSAAQLMLDAGVGVLRTLPPPSEDTIDGLRRAARALDVDWPAGVGYADLVRSLDATRATRAALLAQAARLFRGAGYLGFDGERPAPDAATHAAVAAPYAHVTAPLRRLVDRFGNELVLAHVDGRPPPAWARDALDELPDLMADGRQREGAADGMALDLVEAAVLADRTGAVLGGVVTSVSKDGRASVQIRDPAVVARITADGLAAGAEVHLRVASTDVEHRRVDFDVHYQS